VGVVNDFNNDERMSDRWDENKTSFRLRWNEATPSITARRFLASKSFTDLTFVIAMPRGILFNLLSIYKNRFGYETIKSSNPTRPRRRTKKALWLKSDLGLSSIPFASFMAPLEDNLSFAMPTLSRPTNQEPKWRDKRDWFTWHAKMLKRNKNCDSKNWSCPKIHWIAYFAK
jgi:hypothetical protein